MHINKTNNIDFLQKPQHNNTSISNLNYQHHQIIHYLNRISETFGWVHSRSINKITLTQQYLLGLK